MSDAASMNLTFQNKRSMSDIIHAFIHFNVPRGDCPIEHNHKFQCPCLAYHFQHENQLPTIFMAKRTELVSFVGAHSSYV